ncbi:MAG: GDP-L-fucose synthase [Alphaproteobacteria bacterium]|jgi:GDP-L-fucose synthase|nr:GDP-L-fucose synthase [Alphaproteobacteria bacterium]
MVGKIFDLAGRRVFVAGHRGMVGSALVRRLGVVDCQVMTTGRDKLDLLDGAATHQYLADAKPDVVIVAAAKVGGIHANNTYPAEFIQENLGIALNTIHGSYKAGVKKLLFLGSSCIYPKLARQPMTEDELLAGPLEPTNESYAVAKIAGIKLCQAYRRQYGADFISVMPTNLYGAGDNYHPENSHVVAALIRRFHEAKQSRAPSVTIWGTGAPRREFLFVDDLADACIFVLEHYSGETHLNVGTGEDTTIAEFAQTVSDIVGYEGQLTFDTTRPDGSPQKLLDVSKLDAMGWRATTPLRTGVATAYADFLADGGRGRHDR